jgi:hypothetical protein
MNIADELELHAAGSRSTLTIAKHTDHLGGSCRRDGAPVNGP